MDRLEGAVAFFDIGDTLASVTVSSGGDRIERRRVYPYVPGVLDADADRRRCGVGAEKGILDSTINGERMTGHVERYAGARPAAGDGAVTASRHIHHTDNAVAVATLVADWKRSATDAWPCAGTASPTRDGRWTTSRPNLPGTGSTGWW